MDTQPANRAGREGAMWVETSRLQEVDSALQAGKRDDIDRLLASILQTGASQNAIPTACPTCRRDLIRTTLPHPRLFVSACPERHGAWMSRDVLEALRRFVDAEASLAAKKRHVIRVLNRAVALAGLALLGALAMSYAITRGWISAPSVAVATTLDREEWIYFQHLMRLLEEGTSNRLGLEVALKTRSTPEEYAARYETYRANQRGLLGRLNRLDPPAKLRPVHERIVVATEHQIEFYGDFVAAKSNDPSIDLNAMMTHPALRLTDGELHAAYDLVRRLYPNLDHATGEAIDQHLCAFDVI